MPGGRTRGSRRGARHRVVAGLLIAVTALAAGACLPAAVRPTPPPTPTPTPLPTRPPIPTPTPTPGPPTPSPTPAWTFHKVVRGDTLTSIARQYKTDGRSIAYWNREQYPTLDPESDRYQPNRLERGWVLRLLPRQKYVPPPDDGETGESPSPTPPDEYESSPPEASPTG